MSEFSQTHYSHHNPLAGNASNFNASQMPIKNRVNNIEVRLTLTNIMYTIGQYERFHPQLERKQEGHPDSQK